MPAGQPEISSAGDDERRIRALHDLAARVGRPDRRLLLETAAVELIERLEDAGLPVLLLKGPVLSARLYHAGEHRACTDIDVLLAPGSRDAAGRVLVGLGYENLSEHRGIDETLGVLSAETWFRPYGVPVDLHWRLPGCDAPPQDAWERLYEGRQAIDLGGRPVFALSLPGIALHVAMHAAQHGTNDLKAMADLARAVERWTLDAWRSAALLAAAIQATEALAAGLRLLPRGAAMADELRLPSGRRLIWEVEHRHVRPRGTSHLDALLRAGGTRRRLEVLRRSLLPTRAWIAWEYSTRGSRARLLAGYLRHLLRAPGWAARAWRYRRSERSDSGRTAKR